MSYDIVANVVFIDTRVYNVIEYQLSSNRKNNNYEGKLFTVENTATYSDLNQLTSDLDIAELTITRLSVA